MSIQSKSKKIAIIGAGASGLTSAWLLEKDYEITVYEKNNRLGGHACTIQVPTPEGKVYIDAGFEFFSDALFPTFKRFLHILNVPIKRYQLTYSFFKPHTEQAIALPIVRDKKIAWKSLLPSNLMYLIQFGYCIYMGKKFISQKKTHITLQHFINSLYLTKSFKEHFLYPILSSGWGDSIAEFKKFSAYDILNWVVKNKFSGFKPMYWYEIESGTSAYINCLVQSLKNTIIKKEVLIKTLQYKNSHYSIELTDNSTAQYDYVIFATDAQQASMLLKDIQHAAPTCTILNQIEYFPTTIAIHGDNSFMPRDKAAWSVANVRYTAHEGLLTIYKARPNMQPIFRSWIKDTDITKLPLPLYALEHFHHARVNAAYFKAQKELGLVQGNDNLFFAGIYTTGIDAHESAIKSAIYIAQKLAPQSERLQALQEQKYE